MTKSGGRGPRMWYDVGSWERLNEGLALRARFTDMTLENNDRAYAKNKESKLLLSWANGHDKCISSLCSSPWQIKDMRRRLECIPWAWRAVRFDGTDLIITYCNPMSLPPNNRGKADRYLSSRPAVGQEYHRMIIKFVIRSAEDEGAYGIAVDLKATDLLVRLESLDWGATLAQAGCYFCKGNEQRVRRIQA